MPEFGDNLATFSGQTIPGLLSTVCAEHGDRTAIRDALGNREVTFDSLATQVLDLSLRLGTEAAPGSVVAVAGEGGLDFQLALLAGVTQHVVAPLGSLHTQSEYERQLAATCAELVVTTSQIPALVSAAEALDIEVSSVEEIRRNQVPRAGLAYHPLPDDRAAILLTSGSTAQPKAITLTHRNLTSSALSVKKSLGLTQNDRCLTMWEQHHIGGLVDLLLAPLSAGGCVINGGSFVLHTALSLLKSEKPTWMQFVPTTLSETINEVRRAGKGPPAASLRFMRCVAAPLPDMLWDSAQSALGCPLVFTYGLTEAGPLVSSTSVVANSRKSGSSGKPVSVEVRVLASDGTVAPPDSVGEIVIRGESVFTGYIGSSGEVVFPSEGSFYRTGDLGYLDESGELFIVGREKFLISRGGEKINPFEVESALLEHSEVSDAAVFGVTHPTLGESIEAAVVLRATVTSGALRAHLHSRLTAHKIPVAFHIVERLPLSAIGKLDRGALPKIVAESVPRLTSTNKVELEQIIRRIWATELDAANLPTWRSFEGAGGDSLSALRLGIEIENQLGLKSGVINIHGGTTIRSLAHQLDVIGNLARSNVRNGAVSPPLAAWTTMAVEELAETITGSNPAGSYRELSQQAALTIFTAHELHELIRAVRGQLPGYLGPEQPLVRWGPADGPLQGNPESAWSRERLGPEVMSYRRKVSGPTDRSLLAFTGNTARLMLPIHLILGELPGEFGRVVLVTDSSRRHYESGIRDLASAADQLPQALLGCIPKVDQQDVSIMGTSAGGLVALATGLAWGVDRIGLVGPDKLSDHVIYRAMIERYLAERDTTSRVRIRFGRNSRDLLGALLLRRVVPTTQLSMSRSSRHIVLKTDHQRRRLAASLAWLVGG